jgi:hypothetical protein
MDKIIFAQLLEHVPKRSFKKRATKLDNSNGNQKLSSWEQFLCMSFAQLTSCSGLRNIETCLRAMSSKLYHIGLYSDISKTSLSRINDTRSSTIFKSLCESLIKIAKELYKDDKFCNSINEIVYVLDSTYISLCLSMFPWAQIGKQNRSTIKIHTLMDLRGSIPSFIDISDASVSDNKILDKIQIEPGAFYVMDKAYVDFKRLSFIEESKGFFIVRFKINIKFKRIYSEPSDQAKGVISDQVGHLNGSVGKIKYTNKVRKITFHDQERNKTLVFMTNNFSLPADSIALLYKKRWQIEIFFKWIKQNLKIKKFYGYSQNAVETQIWIAISTYLMVAIAKKKLNLKQPLHQILHFLSISLFENTSLFEALRQNDNSNTNTKFPKQLNLFN